MSSNSSNSSDLKSGNTKQISPSLHWCFTLNNYARADIDEFSSNSSVSAYCFQEEVGEKGTPHLQGYVKFEKKVRPKSIFNDTRIHWEKCRNIKASIAYCSKEDTRNGELFYKNVVIPKELKLIKPTRDWEIKILNLIKEEPNDRTIMWSGKIKVDLVKVVLLNICVLNIML